MAFVEIEYLLQKSIQEALDRRHKLIIITGFNELSETIYEKLGLLSINLNIELSKRLLEISKNKRSRNIDLFIKTIVSDSEKEQILVFEKIELLFLPELQSDPIRLFEEISKDRIIIVLWPGKNEEGILSYAEPWHEEYRIYSDADAIIL